MTDWMDGRLGRGAILAVAVSFLIVAVRAFQAVIKKVCRRSDKPRCGTLEIISQGIDAKFEIIAVHGLGAHPDHTWTKAEPANSAEKPGESKTLDRGRARRPKRVHLLRNLLTQSFPEARILSFADNSTWLGDAPVKTAEEIGKSLLEEIKIKRSPPHLPIIFIGHSMGGIIIKQALCMPESQEIIKNTSGIIFLGTPHQGSSASVVGALLAFLTGFLGSDTTLLNSMKSHDPQLRNLRRKFGIIVSGNEPQRQKIPIISFYETKPTYFFRWLSVGVVVPQDSAVVHADKEYGIDTDHTGLNKCSGLNDQLYKKLKKSIDDLRAPSRLEQADRVIREEYYTEDKLKIERLSGDPLPMDTCYINLAIVEQPGERISRSNKGAATASPFSLLPRQKVETPDETIQIQLATIFNQCQGRDGKMKQPRRILIRGRAGVGKTTLCKKMVHGFIHDKTWAEYFDRLLWVPLRHLKRRQAAGYNLEDLFYHEFFQNALDGRGLANEMWRSVEGSNLGKTLFILDGLDEVSQFLGGDDDMSDFLTRLLNQPNVIITSRPSANLAAGIQAVDLELEAIGFYPDQVKAYLDANAKTKPWADKIQSLLETHWLLQGLVRIPIQLDALCYIWEDIDPHDASNMPNTMTRIYDAIVQKLWIKDGVRLEKILKSDARPLPTEMQRKVKHEIALLECLAFNGLVADLIDFTPAQRDKIFDHLVKMDSEFSLNSTLDNTLAWLSFIRTSDPSSTSEHRNYHFIHLTYQEYFAAQYFKRHWQHGKPLECLFLMNPESTNPDDFIRMHKYTARYDIMWRFVAGLCDTDGKGKAGPFFDLLKKEPLDLFGPAHQRLIMHCLAEVVQSDGFRTSLEDQLSQWLEFECKLHNRSYHFRKVSHLASEMEFPERALNAALQRASESAKIKVLGSLCHRQNLPLKTIDLVTDWLQGHMVSKQLRLAALDMLGDRHERLPSQTLKAVIMSMDRGDSAIGHKAARVLQNQRDWSEEILRAVIERFERDDDGQQIAAEALKGQTTLPQDVLRILVSRLKSQWRTVRGAALTALRGQSTLPKDIVQAIVAGLVNPRDIERESVQILQCQPTLPEKRVGSWIGPEDIEKESLELLHCQLTLPHDVIGEWLGNEHRDSLWDQMEFFNGPFSWDILRVIAEQFGNQDTRIQHNAMRAIQRQLPHFPHDVARAMATWVKGQDGVIRRMALEVLKIPRKWPEDVFKAVMVPLGDQDRDVRLMALEVFKNAKELPEDILKAVMVPLGDQDRDVRLMALEVFKNVEDLPEDILKAVMVQLENQDDCSKSIAMQVLQRQLTFSGDVYQTMTTWLDDRDRAIRRMALEILRGKDDLPEDVLKAVLEQLEDEDEAVRKAALRTLRAPSKQRAFPDDSLRAIAAQLEDKNEDVRLEVLEVIGALGFQQTFSDDVLQTIKAQFENTDLSTPNRQAALDAVPGQVAQPENILKAVVACLEDEDSAVRCCALGALKRQPTLSQDILTAVTARLEDEQVSVRENAGKTLFYQRVLSEDILFALTTRIEDENEVDTVRVWAIEILYAQQMLPERILEAIAACSVGMSGSIKQIIMQILQRQRGLPERIFTAVAPGMDDMNFQARREVVKLLQAHPALPDQVLRDLTAKLKDDDETIKWAVIEVLRRQSALPDTILKSVDLYPIWLARCFEEHVCCYIEGGISYLDMPAGLGKVRLEGHPDVLRHAIRERQKELATPAWDD